MKFYKFMRFICYLPIYIGLPTKVIGNNLPKEGKFILTCNHQSLNDVLVVCIKVKRVIRFIAKKELFKSKLMAWFMKRMGVIAVDRDKPDLSSFKNVVKVLKEGGVVGVFPEGTRNKKQDGKLLPFKSGVAMFALKTKTPIVPMLLVRKPKLFRRNQLVIGEPFELTEYYDKPIDAEVLDVATEIIYQKTLALKEKTTIKCKKLKKA